MATRCRCPPENSCGYRAACSGCNPTRLRMSPTRSRRSFEPIPPAANGSPMDTPIFSRGFSEENGS